MRIISDFNIDQGRKKVPRGCEGVCFKICQRALPELVTGFLTYPRDPPPVSNDFSMLKSCDNMSTFGLLAEITIQCLHFNDNVQYATTVNLYAVVTRMSAPFVVVFPFEEPEKEQNDAWPPQRNSGRKHK